MSILEKINIVIATFRRVNDKDWSFGLYNNPYEILLGRVEYNELKNITYIGNIENKDGVEIWSERLSIKITMIDKEHYCWAS